MYLKHDLLLSSDKERDDKGLVQLHKSKPITDTFHFLFQLHF